MFNTIYAAINLQVVDLWEEVQGAYALTFIKIVESDYEIFFNFKIKKKFLWEFKIFNQNEFIKII